MEIIFFFFVEIQIIVFYGDYLFFFFVEIQIIVFYEDYLKKKKKDYSTRNVKSGVWYNYSVL